MMNLGLIFLLGTGINVVVALLVLFIKSLIKKVSFKSLLLDCNNLFQLGAFIVLYFIISLIIYLVYSRANAMSFVWLGLSTSLVTVLVPYKAIFFAFKNKDFSGSNIFKLLGFIGPVVILVLEVGLFSNASSYKKDNNMQVVSFDSTLIVSTTGTKDEGYITFDKQRQNIVFDNKEHTINSLYLDLSSKVETALQVDIYTSNMPDEGFGFRRAYRFNPNISEFEYFDVKDYAKSDYVMVVFVIDETNLYSGDQISPITLRQIVINKAFPFVFNMLRFTLLTAGYSLILLAVKKAKDLSYKEVDKIALLKKVVLIICGVGLIYLIINSIVCSSTHYVLASSITGKENSENIYYQLFHAFKNGHPYLDYEPSPELLALDNPYIPSNRDGIWYLWDHAFYKGKYYCYYGCAPVILVMFPIYFLTGCKYTPSILFVEEIGVLLSVTFFLLAALELVKLMFKKINYPVLIFTLVCALFSSLLLSNAIYKVGFYNEGIYRVPYSYGLGFLFLALYMLFKAYNNQKHRIIYLGVLGLSVVLMMASRPTLIMALLLTAPVFIKFVIEKGVSWKTKIINFVPMVIVLIIGAIFICYYNYIRYESIFEFGQTYQLTLADNTKLAYSPEGIAPTLFHFFILPPSFRMESFPYFDYGWFDGVPKYHNYNSGAVGLLMFPLFYGFFGMPFTFDKEDDKTLKIMFYLSPLAIFLLAFTTYCFAGVCPRYVVEMTAVTALFCIVPAIKLFDKLRQKNHHVAMGYLLVSGLFSAFLSINLLFSGFDGWREADNHGLLELIRSLFNNYNI